MGGSPEALLSAGSGSHLRRNSLRFWRSRALIAFVKGGPRTATETNPRDAQTVWRGRYARALAHLDSIRRLLDAEAATLEEHGTNWGHVGHVGRVVEGLREVEATFLDVEPGDLE